MQVSTVTRVFEERAQRAPDSPFFHCGAPADPWVTPGELDVKSGRLAGGLAALGVGHGDRVALLAPNCIEVVEVLLAMAKLGAVQVPLNYWIRGEFLQYQLSDCGARVLIADRAGYQTAEPLLSGTGIEHVVIIDDQDDEPPSGRLRYADLAAADPVPDAVVTPGDLLSIVYTSGTTSKPKGCMLSHGYYTSIAGVYGQDDWIIPGDRTCTPFPLFHSAGQIVGFTAALVHDVSFAVTPEFHASTFMAHAAALDATVLIGIGAFANAILDQPRRPEDGAHPFRLAIWTPLPAARQHEFEERFRTPVISEGFGQTESLLITKSPVRGRRDRATSGPASPLYEVRIVDEEDNPVPAGEAGEIVVRPKDPHTMYSGYWNKPDVTVATWRNLWHHTGDFGRMDERGFVSFVDRMKDRLRRRGENISSVHLEETLRLLPGVADVAVSGLPGELGDDDIKACIVETEPDALSAAAVFDFLRDRVAYFAIPRYVHIHETLPVNALQRVMKDRLRAEGVPDGCWDLEKLGLVVARDDRRGAGKASAPAATTTAPAPVASA
jgi:crotonobetaine/carnitine-CoA ligase